MPTTKGSEMKSSSRRNRYKKLMADGSFKTYEYRSLTKDIRLYFQNEEERKEFKKKFELGQKRAGYKSNTAFLTFLLDRFLSSEKSQLPCSAETKTDNIPSQEPLYLIPCWLVEVHDEVKGYTDYVHLYSIYTRHVKANCTHVRPS